LQKKYLCTAADKAPRRRRWYQFRLSTILVLVGILAWAMAWWPAIDYGRYFHKPTEGATRFGASISVNNKDGRFGVTGTKEVDNIGVDIYRVGQSGSIYWRKVWFLTVSPKASVCPVLALAAFLTWKLGWVIAARRKRRREEVAPIR